MSDHSEDLLRLAAAEKECEDLRARAEAAEAEAKRIKETIADIVTATAKDVLKAFERTREVVEALVGMVANACTVDLHLSTMSSGTYQYAIQVLVACGSAEWIEVGRTARWTR